MCGSGANCSVTPAQGPFRLDAVREPVLEGVLNPGVAAPWQREHLRPRCRGIEAANRNRLAMRLRHRRSIPALCGNAGPDGTVLASLARREPSAVCAGKQVHPSRPAPAPPPVRAGAAGRNGA